MLPNTAEARTLGQTLPRRNRRAGSNGRGADFVLLEQNRELDRVAEVEKTPPLYMEAVPFKRPNFIERQQQRESSVVRWCRNTVRWFFESFLVAALVASVAQFS
jgi:hypothetical protein